MALKPPVLCYPVCDLESELPVGWTPGKTCIASVSVSNNISTSYSSSSSRSAGSVTTAAPSAAKACGVSSGVDSDAIGGTISSHSATTTTTTGHATAGSVASTQSVLPRLQDCLQFKPGSTVGDVFEALKRGALSSSAAVVHGEFVRADGRPLSGTKVTQLRKDSVLDANIAVLRVQTNRKSVWQGGAAPAVAL